MPARENMKAKLPKTKSPEEWTALFSAIDTRYETQTRNHALLYLLYMSGLRVGEALSLHLCDLDFERMRLHVRKGKSGERNIPLPESDTLEMTIGRWLGVRERWNPDSPLLFVTKPGMPLSSNAVRESMSVYAERAGIGHATPHQLRHSAATELLAHGASPIGVQRILGHARLSTTLDIYASAADCHAAEAMSKR